MLPRLRPGTVDDVANCAELWMHAIAQRDLTEPAREVRDRALAKFHHPWAAFCVAEHPAGLAGFALAVKRGEGADRYAHLTLLAVAATQRRRGFARKLLADVTAQLQGAGYRRADLRVLAHNSAARRLYEAAGWQPVPVSPQARPSTPTTFVTYAAAFH